MTFLFANIAVGMQSETVGRGAAGAFYQSMLAGAAECFANTPDIFSRISSKGDFHGITGKGRGGELLGISEGLIKRCCGFSNLVVFWGEVIQLPKMANDLIGNDNNDVADLLIFRATHLIKYRHATCDGKNSVNDYAVKVDI